MVMSTINRLLKDKRGNFATMAIFGFPVMFASVALSLDVMNALRLKTELQNANDTAVLFATRNYQEKKVVPSVAEVTAFLQANFKSGTPANVNISIDSAKTTITLTADASVKPMLMNYFSPGMLKASVLSKSKMGVTGSLEFALALDTTGSMSSDNKLANLKIAATNFVNMLYDLKDRGADISGSVVPFAAYVNVGTSNAGASWLTNTDTKYTYKQVPKYKQVWTNTGTKKKPKWQWVDVQDGYDTVVDQTLTWNGCVGSRPTPRNTIEPYGSTKFPALVGISCSDSLQPLTSSRSTLVNKINSLSASGWTYIPEGVMWGARTLTSSEPFTQGKPPVDPTASVVKKARKVLIVMTDGENTLSPGTWQAPYNEFSPSSAFHYDPNNGADTVAADSNTLKACTEAKSKDLEVYTISFGTVPNAVKTMLASCASSPNNYFHASTGTALNEAFKDIGDELLSIHLSQ